MLNECKRLFSTIEATRMITSRRIRDVFDGVAANAATYHAPQNGAGNGLDSIPSCVGNPKYRSARSHGLAGTSECSLSWMGACSFQRRHLRRDIIDCILVHSSYCGSGTPLHAGDVCGHSAMARRNGTAPMGFCY